MAAGTGRGGVRFCDAAAACHEDGATATDWACVDIHTACLEPTQFNTPVLAVMIDTPSFMLFQNEQRRTPVVLRFDDEPESEVQALLDSGQQGVIIMHSRFPVLDSIRSRKKLSVHLTGYCGNSYAFSFDLEGFSDVEAELTRAGCQISASAETKPVD